MIDWFPPAASKEAGPVDTLWHVLLIFSIPIFVGVTVVVGFAILRFRMRPGEENLDGPPIHGNTRLEVVWTAIPAIILVGLCTYSFVVLEDVEAVSGKPVEVRVVGEQFAWTYFVDQNGKEVASNDLHLPVGRQVRFTLQSKDVLHDFWVPAFRIKKDAVPGIDVKYTVTPSKVGTYPVVCAELCGLGHAVMRSSVTVEPQDKYEAWLANVGKPAATPTGGGGGGETDGKAIFTSAQTNCGTCHTLADAGTKGTIGPDLDDVLADKDEAFIKESIVDPNKVIADGYQSGVMPPNYGQTLQPAQIDALAKYLSEVTKGG
ncbi:MAG TPA: cytochrome c oxidase subunit II [Solirubrobacter sp.]|nr:cytochrome c oxidase subunit II [Solirubrobacter sp.]